MKGNNIQIKKIRFSYLLPSKIIIRKEKTFIQKKKK